MAWYSHLFKSFPVCCDSCSQILWCSQKAEVDALLKLSCFSDDQTDVANIISGSSAFSKSSLNIWKFMLHVLSKLGLENFEHYFASMWDECGCLSLL